MEIDAIGRNNRTSFRKDENKVNEKKEFSQNFKDAKDRRSNEELKKMIENIKSKGNRLIVSKSYADVRAYKRLIKEYLESILKHMYNVKNDISFWQSQYFITVQTIDEKLEELTDSLLSQEKENLEIASTIDKIQGLMIDIYK